MRRIWLPLLLVAGPVAADPIPDEGVEVNPEPRMTGGCNCEISKPKILTIRGRAWIKSSGEVAVGATIIVSEHGGKATYPAITDELGDYKIEVPPGFYDVTVYYVDVTIETVKQRMFVDDVLLDPVLIDDTAIESYTACFSGPAPPEFTSMPHFGAAISRHVLPVSRDRRHRAWIAPVAFADPARVVTTVEGARRFTTAPGIPTAFVEDVTTYSRDVPFALSTGSGGAAEVSLRSGSNQRRSEARLILGADDHADDSASAETFLGGPISKDHAWAAAGLVLGRNGGALTGDGMLRLDAHAHDHDFTLAGLAHDGVDEDAGWTTARWKAKYFDAKLEVGALATGERLERSSELAAREVAVDPTRTIDRAGGLAYAKLRFKAAGYHTAYASAGGGAGRRDELHHTDLSFAIGDEWMWSPSLTFTAGVRVEERTFDGDRARRVAPRVALKWDPTHEGRGEVFVGYQRVPLVDDGLPGDWRSLDVIAVDEMYAGVGYRRSSGDTMVGLAVRQRDDRTGGDAWIRRDTARTVVHLQATSLDRVATLLAQRKLRDRSGTLITLGTTARVTEDRSEAGVALGWKRSSSDRERTAEVTAEGHAGTAGPGARIVVGMFW